MLATACGLRNPASRETTEPLRFLQAGSTIKALFMAQREIDV